METPCQLFVASRIGRGRMSWDSVESLVIKWCHIEESYCTLLHQAPTDALELALTLPSSSALRGPLTLEEVVSVTPMWKSSSSLLSANPCGVGVCVCVCVRVGLYVCTFSEWNHGLSRDSSNRNRDMQADVVFEEAALQNHNTAYWVALKWMSECTTIFVRPLQISFSYITPSHTPPLPRDVWRHIAVSGPNITLLANHRWMWIQYRCF